ncbi:glucuronate isomerase [Oleiagrimonas sp. C23AA]|uniref:glucuronate isomerase n=1 Tax=Oleiagrimonas sp. C23AA TaxID=2719047 RepID=UPI0019815A18
MKIELSEDRLFPVDAGTRKIARSLYERVADLPIISPHGHVSPVLLLDDRPFADPAELFIRHDHYVTRVMHSMGVDFSRLGIPDRRGGDEPASPREAWKTFCEHWHAYAGTASGYWLTDVFVRLFGIDEAPCADNADMLFDTIQQALQQTSFRPRALFDRFNIEVLATTDDPLDTLIPHRALAQDQSFKGRVIPTFRPDAYLDPMAEGWRERVFALLDASDATGTDYLAYIDALEVQRQRFIEMGAVSADHGVRQPLTVEMGRMEAAALFDAGMKGKLDKKDAVRFAGHMLMEMARMSVQDGLVMTIHPGVYRNHHNETLEHYGRDMGHDIPVRTRFAQSLRPLLERYGTAAGFHLVLFTVDETNFSREIAPLAGCYPSVYIGAPWWFLDAPDAVQRFRSAVTETAGFYKSSGFIDDTRAFLSIPARHDMSRRLDASFLARLVGEGRLPRAMAERVMIDLVDTMPRKVFKL